MKKHGTQLGQSFSVTDNVLLIAHDDEFDINTDSVKLTHVQLLAFNLKTLKIHLTQIPKFKVRC